MPNGKKHKKDKKKKPGGYIDPKYAFPVGKDKPKIGAHREKPKGK